jgi:acetyl-CoA carboxylase carboxyl transferase subunit alpha
MRKGMPSPHGYRTALRLMQLAEKFYLPVVTLVDTVGAWPTFQCEVSGQSEAIATNLTLMAGLKVPIVTGTCYSSVVVVCVVLTFVGTLQSSWAREAPAGHWAFAWVTQSA